jgi:hypothetical protein
MWTMSYRRTACRCAQAWGHSCTCSTPRPANPRRHRDLAGRNPASAWRYVAWLSVGQNRPRSGDGRPRCPGMCRPEPAGRNRRFPPLQRLPGRPDQLLKPARVQPPRLGCQCVAAALRDQRGIRAQQGAPPRHVRTQRPRRRRRWAAPTAPRPAAPPEPPGPPPPSATPAPRGFGPPSASAWSSLTACTGPRMPNSTTGLTPPYATPRARHRRPPAPAWQPARQVRRRRSPLPQRPRKRRRMRQEQALATTGPQQIRLPVLWIRRTVISKV